MPPTHPPQRGGGGVGLLGWGGLVVSEAKNAHDISPENRSYMLHATTKWEPPERWTRAVVCCLTIFQDLSCLASVSACNMTSNGEQISSNYNNRH
jgi:hypothetical protein